MTRTLLYGALALALAVSSVHSATYYVATTGSDTANGTSLATAYKTIQKAASVMLAGDTCYVCGGTYRETVTPAHSGSSGLPITFTNYNGQLVTVSGADTISSWTLSSGSIYKAPMSWDMGRGLNQVFVDGQMMNEARWPNTGTDLLHPTLATVKSSTGYNELEDTALNQPAGTWTNAIVWLLPGANVNNPWVARMGNVTSYTPASGTTPGKIVTDFASTTDPNYFPSPGNLYYLTFGALSTLDSAGEWQLNTGNLYLWTPNGANPSTHTVEARHRTNAFNLTSRNYVTVTGFNFFSATVNLTSATNCLVDLCNFQYISHFTFNSNGWDTGENTGIIVSGSGNTVRHCWIDTSAGNAVSLMGTNNTVVDCVMHDVDYQAIDSDGIHVKGTNLVAKRNTIYNAGHTGISTRCQTCLIEYNDISRYCMLTKDSGGTDSGRTDGMGTEICYNWFHDTGTGLFTTDLHTPGVYLDNSSSNYIADHNVIWHTDEGIRLNTPSTSNKIYNNVCYDQVSPHGISGSGDGSGAPPDFPGTKIINNILDGPIVTNTNGTMANNIVPPTDPKYVDPANHDFELQATSPAINAGQVLSPYTDGYTGTAPDIGAYETGLPRWTAGARYEAETLTVPNTSGDPVRIITGSFSDGSASILDATAVGDYITYLVPNLPAGAYHIWVGTKKHLDRGQFQLSIGRADDFGNAKNVGAVQDEYSATDLYTELDLGLWSPGTTSDKWFRFTVTGKNAASSGYSICFDYFRLEPQ